MNDETQAHEPPVTSGRGGARPGAGRKSGEAKDEKRRRKAADKMASLLFGGVEKRLVMTGGDKWRADDDERTEIIESAGDIIFDLIEDYPHYLRLCVAIGAYSAGRVSLPNKDGGLRGWFKRKKKDEKEEDDGRQDGKKDTAGG